MPDPADIEPDYFQEEEDARVEARERDDRRSEKWCHYDALPAADRDELRRRVEREAVS